MKKGLKLILALVALAALVGGYFIVSHFIGSDETQTDEEIETIAVKTFDASDITGIKYVYGDETVELVKKDGKWRLSSDEMFPVNQAYPETMVSETAGLTAQRLVSETSESFSEYGLSEPSEAFIFTKDGGGTFTVFIGAYNSFSDACYVNISGTENVYLIDSAYIENFHYGLKELADIDDLPVIESGEVTEIKIKTDSSQIDLKYYEDGLDTVYSDTYRWFTHDGTALETTSVSSLISASSGFASAGCADYSASDEKLREYGFSDPAAVLEIFYTETDENETGELDDDGNEISTIVTTDKVLKLTVGKQAAEGTHSYAKLDGSNVVYLIDASYAEALANVDIESLLPMDVCMISMDSVDSLDVTTGGKTSKITVTRAKDSDGEESTSYTMDGKTITASDYDAFFSSVQSMRAESSTNEAKTGGDPFLTVVYHRNTSNFKTMTLKFVPFDSSFYLVEFNGENRLLVNKNDVSDAVAAFKKIKLY
ncbi:MAG: DUF4340 domain-containing protein [Clostridiales bacterium]|nr:DUF4340 domain-containing protein [Clostridiales bacterium]